MTPLFDAILRYKKVKGRFHMPSHGGCVLKGAMGLYASAPFDVTELSFTDVLSESSGVILEAERLAARAYGAAHTLFFSAGATDAVRTALLCVKDKKIAFLGDMHKSFSAAKRLFSLDATDITDVADIRSGGFGAVCVTSPDYYGRTRDIPSIAAACREAGALLVVDEAHGAHFAFSSLLPQSAVGYADFTIHGAHKTLPVYTGGAMLHVGEPYYEAARAARSEVTGTSPSYLVLASLDYARDLFERRGEELYGKVKRLIDRAKERHPTLDLLSAEDFTRVVIRRENGGFALAAHLEKAGYYAEAADADRVVLIVTPFNAKRLDGAFAAAEKCVELNAKYPDISDIIGKVSVYDVGIYPPGVPIVKQGELFTADKVGVLQRNLDRLFGTVNGKIITK